MSTWYCDGHVPRPTDDATDPCAWCCGFTPPLTPEERLLLAIFGAPPIPEAS